MGTDWGLVRLLESISQALDVWERRAHVWKGEHPLPKLSGWLSKSKEIRISPLGSQTLVYNHLWGVCCGTFCMGIAIWCFLYSPATIPKHCNCNSQSKSTSLCPFHMLISLYGMPFPTPSIPLSQLTHPTGIHFEIISLIRPLRTTAHPNQGKEITCILSSNGLSDVSPPLRSNCGTTASSEPSREPSYPAAGSVNWHNHYGEQCRNSLKT